MHRLLLVIFLISNSIMSTPHPSTREMGGRRKSSSSSKRRSSKKTTFNSPRAPGIQTGQASGVSPRPFLDDEEVGVGSTGSTSTSTRMAHRARIHIPIVAESSTPTHGGIWKTTVLWSIGVIDFGLGVSCIVYGALVHDVIPVMAVSISYGILLLLGSIAGAVGYFTSNRMCYLTSAIFGFLTVLLDIVALIAILISWTTLIVFLNTNHENLMLSEDLVDTIQSQKVLIAIIFAVLAVLELVRGCVLWDITKKNTVSPAPAGYTHSSLGNRSVGSGGSVGSQSRRSSGNKKSNNWFLSLFGIAKRKKVDDMIMFHDNTSMEAPLLWSSNQRTEPSADDYLNFIPQHERSIANYSHVELPLPPVDRTDY